MKLLLTWSQYQQWANFTLTLPLQHVYFFRYHSLLGISIPQSGSAGSSDTSEHSSSILYYVYSCLFAQRVSLKVCSCVMEMTINLLSDYDSHDQEQKITKNGTQDSEETKEAGMGMEIQNSICGSDLVLPLIPMLLSYMSTVIESEGRRVKASSEPRNLHLEFTVISKYVDPNSCLLLLATWAFPWYTFLQNQPVC